MKSNQTDTRITYLGVYPCRGYGCHFSDAELERAGYIERRCDLGERCPCLRQCDLGEKCPSKASRTALPSSE